MKQLLGRDLRPGDVMLKFNGHTVVNEAIAFGQRATGGGEFSSIVHAGIMFDNRYIIESQGAGVSANDVYLQNKSWGYFAFRPKQVNLASGAATCAKMFFDVHQQSGGLKYSVPGAFASLFGSGKARSVDEFEQLIDRILEGRTHKFFCSRFVVFVYQYVAAQNRLPPAALFPMSDAKASPASLASNLKGNGFFEFIGELAPNRRN